MVQLLVSPGTRRGFLCPSSVSNRAPVCGVDQLVICNPRLHLGADGPSRRVAALTIGL